MTLELHATPEEVMRAVEALQEFGEARKIPGKILFGLTLALEECGSNIVNHGLQRDSKMTFFVNVEHTESKITIELRDPGPEFDPTLRPPGEPEANDDGPPGGWGIFLVHRYTDEIHYTRQRGENVLSLTKYLDSPPSSKNH
jgi:anti-sigma regulatory factor (Ser/Thr protein kinase)